MGSIGSIFGLAGTAAVAAGAAVVAAIAAVVAGIIYTVTHWDEVKEFWTVKVPEWWSGTVVPFFESIPQTLSKIWELVKTTASKKWGDFIDFMSGVPETVGTYITEIWEWFNELPEKIGYALGYALGTVTGWAVELKGYLSKKIPEIINAVYLWFKELPGKIYSAISGSISKVIAWGTEVYEAFNKKVNETITKVAEWFSELPGKIYDKIILIKEKIGQWSEETIRFFSIEVPKIVNKVVGFFEELPGRMKVVGENLIKGLWEGISNLTDWLGTKVGDFCSGIIDGFKAGFDEHSPSKKAFKIGDYFTLGLMGGIIDKFGLINSKIDLFAKEISSKTIDLPLIDTNISVNREILDTLDTTANISYNLNQTDFKATISSELKETMGNIIDYDRLGEVLSRKLERANITAKLNSDEAYSDVKNKWKQEDERYSHIPVIT